MDTRDKPKYDAGIKLSGSQWADAYADMMALLKDGIPLGGVAPKREEIYRRHGKQNEKTGGTA